MSAIALRACAGTVDQVANSAQRVDDKEHHQCVRERGCLTNGDDHPDHDGQDADCPDDRQRHRPKSECSVLVLSISFSLYLGFDLRYLVSCTEMLMKGSAEETRWRARPAPRPELPLPVPIASGVLPDRLRLSG